MPKLMLLLMVSLLIVTGVAAQDDATAALEFRANGEDFVREGFVSKDGWNISFNHVYVVLSQIRAHQTNPPFDPFAGELTRSAVMVGLTDTFILDLAEGEADADTILVGAVEDAPVGYYNALTWRMQPATEGEVAGSSVLIDGTAERDGETVAFVIRIGRSFNYDCGAFIGDERKGVLTAEGGDIELTFHFDHIFGDAGSPLDDSLNVEAPGFDMLAALAVDGVVDVTLADLEAGLSADDYAMFVNVLPSLGHVGEGHCHEF